MYLNEQTQKAILNEMNAPRMDYWSRYLRRRGQSDVLRYLGWYPRCCNRKDRYEINAITPVAPRYSEDWVENCPPEDIFKDLRENPPRRMDKFKLVYGVYVSIAGQKDPPDIAAMLNAERYRGQLDILRAIGYRPAYYGEGFLFRVLEKVDGFQPWLADLPDKERGLLSKLAISMLLEGGAGSWMELLRKAGLLEAHGYIIGWLNA